MCPARSFGGAVNRMKNFLAVVGLASVLVAMPALGQQTWNVTVTEYAFDPTTLTIAPGDTVVWKNTGQVSHRVGLARDTPAGPLVTAVSLQSPTAPPLFDRVLEPGESFSFTFAEQGVYVVQCDLGTQHEQMKMVILVA